MLISLRWNPTTDQETPAAGLSYNLRIGSTPGGNEIFSAQSELTNGFRRLPGIGNMQSQL